LRWGRDIIGQDTDELMNGKGQKKLSRDEGKKDSEYKERKVNGKNRRGKFNMGVFKMQGSTL